MNIIADYGRGNLRSLKNALDRIGMETEISSSPQKIMRADSLIIPGVGAFADAMDAMDAAGLTQVIKDFAKSGKYVLGICLGMQLMYEKGYEYGEREGLGLIKGSIRYLEIEEKVPHMGWNDLKFEKDSDPVLRKIKEGEYVYFVHSYYADSDESEIVAFTEYGTKIPAIVRQGNIYGMQFHPEKSGYTGERLLEAYRDMVEKRRL